MKKTLLPLLAFIAIFSTTKVYAQNKPNTLAPAKANPSVSLVSATQYYTPEYVKDSSNIMRKVITEIRIPVTLTFPVSPAFNNDTIQLNLDSHDIPGNPVLETPVLIISSSMGKGSLDTAVYIKTAALQTSLDKDRLGVLTIAGNTDGSVIIVCKKTNNKVSKLADTGNITILNEQPIDLMVNFSKSAPLREQMIDIPVKLTGDWPGDTGARLVFYIDSTYLLNNAQINPADTAQTISYAEWENAKRNNGLDTFSLRIQSNGRTDTSSDLQTTFIGIKGLSGQGQQIDLVSYNPNKPFWIEVGANFDLASQQLQTTNVFGGVFLHKKDIMPVFNHKRSKNLALVAGVYESKNFSQNNSSAFKIQPYLDSTSFPSGHGGDSIARVYTDSGTVKTSLQTRNIGLFFSPQLRLTKRPADQNGLHFFASFYAEMLWQNVQVNYDYSQVRRIDTTWIGRTDLNSYKGKTNTQQLDFYSHYEGLGIPIIFKEGTANLYLNPVFGISNQPSSQDINNAIMSGESQPSKRWSFFYLVQFRLSEEQYGLSFSGEIRQLVGAQSAPYITLILSKKFDLSKLINFQ